MIQEIYVVETLQYKYFSYSFSAKSIEGGYHVSLEEARQAIEHLTPRKGLWVLISRVPLGVLKPDESKEPLELYEYVDEAKDYRRCFNANSPVERLIFRVLDISYQTNKSQNFRNFG